MARGMADLFWVDGRLAVAARPRGGDWLAEDLAAMRAQGVGLLVSCLMPYEEETLGLAREEEFAAAAGMMFARAPAPDGGTPEAGATEAVVGMIRAALSAGLGVAVHCRAGVGRSPLVVAATLVRMGRAPVEAWATVAEARGRPVPDNEGQRDWLYQFWRRAG